jgi:hypothetical protein
MDQYHDVTTSHGLFSIYGVEIMCTKFPTLTLPPFYDKRNDEGKKICTQFDPLIAAIVFWNETV